MSWNEFDTVKYTEAIFDKLDILSFAIRAEKICILKDL